MNEYTPATEDVRFNYVTGASDGMTYLEVYGDEFDRWLRGGVLADAWDEGYRATGGRGHHEREATNPYREENR